MKLVFSVALAATVLSAPTIAHAGPVACGRNVTVSSFNEKVRKTEWKYKYRLTYNNSAAPSASLRFDKGDHSLTIYYNPVDVNTNLTSNIAEFGKGGGDLAWHVYYDSLPSGASKPNILVSCRTR